MSQSRYRKPDLKLGAELMRIVDADYPKFSAAEMARRRGLVAAAMAEAGVDHLVAYAAFFRGGPVHWISDWLTTYEAVLVFTPGQRDTIFVQFYNHLPQARAVMTEAEIRWGGASTIGSAIAELERRGAKAGRVGAVGLVPMGYYKALEAKFPGVADLNRAYFGLRMVKSKEEIAWYRIAARLSDLPIEALLGELRPGLDERDLGAITEAAYVPWRGSNIIHFFFSTPMAAPDVFVPRQHHTARKLATGDVIACEITASFWEHWGQVLRTFTLGERFTPLYQALHDTAEAAYDAIFKAIKPGLPAKELAVGARVIEEAGFTFYDDLVHGLGGGYLPPILGSPTRGAEPLPDLALQEGMMMVIQPNVVTKDLRAGVQTGELVVVTATGAASLHTAPRGPLHVAV
jgi:Xaa-Pro aminopeptidase